MTAPVDREAALRPLRDRIDGIDDQIVSLLAERMSCVRQVIVIKAKESLPARLDARVEEVVSRVRAKALQAGAAPDLAEAVWRTMIEWVIAYEHGQLTSDTLGDGSA